MSTGQRPWEGTALAIIDIIGVVGAFIFAIIFLLFQGLFSGFAGMAAGQGEVAASGIMNLVSGFGLAIGVFLIAIGILAIFMARGAFKGQKWSPIVSIVLCGLGVLNGLVNIGHMNTILAVYVLVDIFAIYCAVMCMKSPYFK